MKIRKKEQNSPNTALKVSKPINRALDFSDNMNNLVTKEIIRENYELGSGEMHTIELPVLKDTEIRSEYPSKDLEMIVEMFRNSQEIASREV